MTVLDRFEGGLTLEANALLLEPGKDPRRGCGAEPIDLGQALERDHPHLGTAPRERDGGFAADEARSNDEGLGARPSIRSQALRALELAERVDAVDAGLDRVGNERMGAGGEHAGIEAVAPAALVLDLGAIEIESHRGDAELELDSPLLVPRPIVDPELLAGALARRNSLVRGGRW